METYRLKNIAILILLLLNAFLLLLLGYQFYQSRATAADTEAQLRSLFTENQLDLSPQVDLEQPPLRPLSIVRHADTESAIAALLLGGEAERTSQGGGIYSYTGGHGSIQFRSGGSFDSSDLSLPVADAAAFAQTFCESFGYQDLSLQLKDSTGTATAVQYVSGVPIVGCGVSLSFQRGVLTAVSGSHVGVEDAGAIEDEMLTAATALIRFLDYRGAEGIVCSRVEDIQCIYILQSTASTPRLLPAWQVITDTYPYYVDCAVGAVSRR